MNLIRHGMVLFSTWFVLTACGSQSHSTKLMNADEGLEGVYAMRIALSTIDQVSIPGLGDQQESLGISYGHATVLKQDGKLVIREQFCRADSSTTSPAKISIADQAIRLIPVLSVPLTVTEEQGVVSIYRPFSPLAIGVKLADPMDPLPTDTQDARIFDFDGDGKPGMTANLKMYFLKGQIYIIRKENYDYTLSRNAAGHFIGHTVDKGEQLTVGASMALFNKNVPSTQNPDLSKSPAVFIPLEAPIDCDELSSKTDSLFQDYPLAPLK